MSIGINVIGCCLATLLFFSGFSKWVDGYRTGYLLGAVTYYSLATAEIVCALVLGSRFGRAAAWATVALCAGGAAYAWGGGSQPCGCLGQIELTSREHLLWASGTGAISAFYLLLLTHTMMEATRELSETVGKVKACAAFAVPRSSFYRRYPVGPQQAVPAKEHARPARSLGDQEPAKRGYLQW